MSDRWAGHNQTCHRKGHRAGLRGAASSRVDRHHDEGIEGDVVGIHFNTTQNLAVCSLCWTGSRRSRIFGSSRCPSLCRSARFPAGRRLWCSRGACRCRAFLSWPLSADQSEARTLHQCSTFAHSLAGFYFFSFMKKRPTSFQMSWLWMPLLQSMLAIHWLWCWLSSGRGRCIFVNHLSSRCTALWTGEGRLS